jgi:hypothetical protein
LDEEKSKKQKWTSESGKWFWLSIVELFVVVGAVYKACQQWCAPAEKSVKKKTISLLISVSD